MTKPALFHSEHQKQQSEKYKYKHIHTGEYCTFEAYIAELVVLRRYEKMNESRPTYKFWTKGDKDHWLWLKQLGAARQLAKSYSENAIIAAIQSPEFSRYLLIALQNGRGWKINPKFETIVKNYEAKEQAELAQRDLTVKEVVANPTRRTKTKGKGSLINRLRESK